MPTTSSTTTTRTQPTRSVGSLRRESTSSSRWRRESNAELDQSVLKPRGTIAIYANDGGVPFAPDVRANMGLNTRYQFVLLYTVGWARIANAAADLNQAIDDAAFRIGEQAGLPVHRFDLDDTAAAA